MGTVAFSDVLTYQWLLLVGASLVLLFWSPLAKTAQEFFSATNRQGQMPNTWMLASSLAISWIFAKSITNAANLGRDYGWVGGLAYATYYLSFLVGGLVIYRLRVKGGFQSIHQFLQTRYGKGAVAVFSILIAFRLFNEVWSNTMVIGGYFGEPGTSAYYTAIVGFTGLTLAYVLKGGLRSSLFTDAIQLVLFGVLLTVLLGAILPREYFEVGRLFSLPNRNLGGYNLLLVALLQVFSYPFHDPVLTDRGFIAPPKRTLRAYIIATVLGFAAIFLFSVVGFHAHSQGLSGDAAVAVGKTLGLPLMLVMNFIMITSAASTLDSTFTSFTKLAVVDLGRNPNPTVSQGRKVMALIAVIGTIPVFFNPDILSATTISGTMVLGLAPIFLFWRSTPPPLAFYLSVGIGMVFGLTLALGWVPDSLIFFQRKYGDLLSWNLLGTVGCFLGFGLGKLTR